MFSGNPVGLTGRSTALHCFFLAFEARGTAPLELIGGSMAVTAARARKLALVLPGAIEAPHFHRVAFRTKRKIFATLDAAVPDLNLMFNADLRDFYYDRPHKRSRLSMVDGGGWVPRAAT
jgi:hypothetical protein